MSPAPWMKTDQHQGTCHEISEQVRTRGDTTTFRGKTGHIYRTGYQNGFRLTLETEDNGTMPSNFWRKNFIPVKTFSDICGLKILPPNDPL